MKFVDGAQVFVIRGWLFLSDWWNAEIFADFLSERRENLDMARDGGGLLVSSIMKDGMFAPLSE